MAAADGGELVGVYSRDQHRAEAFAQKHDARAAYSQLGDLLKDSRVDGVFVSSPNALHAEHVVQAAEAGKLGRGASLGEEFGAGRIGRRALLRSMLVLGGGLAMAACDAAAQTAPGGASGRMAGGKASVRLAAESGDRLRGRWPVHDGTAGRRARVPVDGRVAGRAGARD